jgi:glutathione S-transferase
MILIGQFDSAFVRRVGIALRLYGLEFEHRPWSTFGDADKLRAFNPLTRVPTLVLDDGDVLVDSTLILDFIDSLVPPASRMVPAQEPDRHRVLKIVGLATGLADKAVALFYEKRMHDVTSERWVERCRTQIGSVLNALESDRAGRKSDFWFGTSMTHADIAVACVLRMMSDLHPELQGLAACPALQRHCDRLEAMPVFQEIRQVFIPPS